MDKKVLALVGVVVLIIGLFLPIMSLPIVGSVNMLLPGGGIGDGVFVLVLALIAGGLALMGHIKHVVWPALGALGFIGYKFFELKGVMDAGRDRIAEQAGGSEIASAFSDAMQVNYLGWGVLCIGGLIVLVAGIMAWTGGAKPTGAA